ncbi:MAG TPA: UDP-N-acetylmuramoyl-tripeptide--D-alanyl-D-alanine ligase, partial [Terriglobia bacterium]|nr:UDP-N-acetylmuramoyl-tripeptide--D-alanyl-D-alanine ligase [Terriglobia bacterium]
ELHRSCGQEAARAGAALIVGVQGEAKSVLDGAREAGAGDEQLKFAADSVEAAEFLSRTVRRGDVVLIKGSRGVKLEQVLSALRQTFSSVEA